MKNVPHNSFILLLQRLQKESEGRAGRWLTHRESSASSFTSWTFHQQRHSSRIFACVHREQTRLFSECSGNVHKRKRREGRRLYLDVWIVEKSEERICFIAFLHWVGFGKYVLAQHICICSHKKKKKGWKWSDVSLKTSSYVTFINGDIMRSFV